MGNFSSTPVVAADHHQVEDLSEMGNFSSIPPAVAADHHQVEDLSEMGKFSSIPAVVADHQKLEDLSGMGTLSSIPAVTADHRQLEDLLEKLHEQLEFRLSEIHLHQVIDVKRLGLCWGRLKHSIDCVKQWSNAAEVVENCGSLVVEIEATGDALVKLLGTCNNWQTYGSEERELSSFWMMVEGLQVPANELHNLEPQITSVIDSISGNISSLKILSPLRDLSLWTQFVEITRDRIMKLDHSSFPPRATILSFISLVHRKYGSGLKTLMPGDEKIVIEGFFDQVAPVIFQAACLCCSSLAGKMRHGALLTALLDEISFANPRFLLITLKVLKALAKIPDGPTHASQADLAQFFVGFFCESGTFLCKDLTDLVMYYIDAPKDPIDEEETGDLDDIKVLVFEATLAFSVKDLFAYYTSCLNLGRRIWLRKVGLFLKQQLLSSEDHIFKNQARGQIDYLADCLNWNELEWNHMVEMSIDDHDCIGVLGELESLYQSFCDCKIGINKVKISISQLLSKVALLSAERTLMKLVNLNNEIVIVPRKLELEALLLHIKFLSALPVLEQITEEKTHLNVQSVSMKITSLAYSFLAKKITAETLKNTVNYLLNEVIKMAKGKNGQYYEKIEKYDLPKISAGVESLDRLLESLLDLHKFKPETSFRYLMEQIQNVLERLRSYIRSSFHEGHDLLAEWKDLGARVTKMIYQLECVIESLKVGVGAHWKHKLWLHTLHSEIILIETMAATKLLSEATGHRHMPKNVSSSRARASKPGTSKLVVRLRDQEQKIIDKLRCYSTKRDLVYIVGMPGLGKTTLAMKVYDDPNISHHFSCRAWCFVSQSYQKRDLLLKLLGEIQKLTDEILEMDDADLELKLWRSLKGKRYLIVLDDVWDVGAWNALQRSFPDDRKGSRIMITSRLSNLAFDASSSPHHLRTLSADESWKLLEMRIFHEEGCCPKELVQAGKEVAAQCKGLALAVVAVAGMLEKTEKEQESWQLILNEINARVLDDPQTQCKSILEMSYNHLPDHLKACFLYLGAFQQNRDIQVKKLIQMWIAEGFIQKTEQKSLEQEAEDSLMDLVDRSLVIVSTRKSKGGVKGCRMHDLFRDLCLSKSKEENFLQLVTSYDEPYASFSDSYDGVDLDTDGPSQLAKYESYRVCTYLKRKHFVDSRPSGPWTRSLIFIPSNDANPRRTYNVSFIWENFKFLRVLDLENINLGASFPTTIEVLVLMRYLALSGDLNSIPESIANLWKLETFIVKGLGGKVILPDTFWSMTSLRHVHVKNQAAFNLQGDKFGNSILLDNLVTISCPCLSYGEDTEKILRKMPNLHKLKCIFLESRDSLGNCNPFPRLGFLMHLESVNILYAGRDRSPGEFNLPSSLKKLTLSRFRLSWSHMSTIGSLPNLEVLKLLSGSLEGLTWDMKDDEFQKLKFLKLDSMNIVRWIASSDHLPELEQLVLWNCGDLEEVPKDFSGLATLQIIEVQRCSESVEKSIRDLQENVEGLQVLISH